MDRAIYDTMAAHDSTHWWYVARRDVLSALIERRCDPRPDMRILEVGCGTGHNLAMLARFGNVEGHELDAAARAVAQSRFGNVGSARLPELENVPDGRYDLIALLDVLEHVENDEAALSSLNRRLAPGGKLLVTVPQHAWLWSGHDVANHHFRRYSRRMLRKAAQAAGLRIEYVTDFNSLLFPLAAVDRLRARVTKREGSDDTPPSASVNALFRSVFALERHVIGRIPLSPGVSLAAVMSPR